jgi:hypothetical protein
MIQPDKPAQAHDDDELDLELPIDGDAEGEEEEETGLPDEESFLPDDDTDLSLSNDDKPIGLDVDTGLEDAEAESSLGDDDDDEGSWLGEDEFDPVLMGEDSDEPEEDEPGGDDTEPAKDNADDWDDLALDESSAPLGDRGEEGFGDDAAASEIELEQLPPLDGSLAADAEENEVDALGTDLLDEIPIAAAEDAPAEIAPGLRCRRIASERVSIETVQRLDRPLSFLVGAGGAALAWDGGLLVARGDARPERHLAGEPRPFAIAALDTGAELSIALGTARGLLCSRDAGLTFAALTPPVAGDWIASSLAWSRGPRGPRLFAAAPAGALWSSDDFGATWQPRAVERVLELTAGGERGVIAICRREDGGASAQYTRDAGETFEAVALPVREVERVQDVRAEGEVLLCCRRAPSPQLVVRVHGGEWREISAFASAPAALLEGAGEVHAYFFVQTQERALLLRRALDGGARLPELVSEFAHDAGTPLQLVAGLSDGAPTLQLGTERGWYRVRVRSAGDDA